MNNQLSLDRIYQAAFALKDVARKTDLIYSPHFSGKNQVYFKTENLQVTGSFKLRGAYFKISKLTEEEKAAGIVACSAGNHAQGVALSAQRMGLKAIICMPDGAPISKVEATKSYGAEVRLVKGAYDDAYAYACKLQDEEHASFIHPFDDPDVIAGQGTIGLEILDQLKDVDAIVVPVGGGGLVSGIAYAAKSLKPEIKVYGVQAREAASMADSLKYDEQVTLSTVNTFADGIAVKHPGDLTFSLIKDYVDDIVTVSEDEIAAAILALIEKQKLIAEGAGAVSVAAVMFDKIPLEGKNVVCLVSGGNIDVNILSRVITRGLVTSGRNATLNIALEDKPGQLVDVATIIASCGANVTGVHYGHSDPNTAVTSCVLMLDIETRDFAQIEEIRKTLTDQGFRLC
ncbi:MAG: threonine ammonia-lyase [Mogibacterium sp.]|nr:threonine ammonia-lyase [Mogibacterium sp.]